MLACSALYDVGMVGNHVRKRNQRQSHETSEASIEPILLEGEGGEPVPGLALRVRW